MQPYVPAPCARARIARTVLVLVVACASCALPPPAEDRPLTGSIEPKRRVDSSVGAPDESGGGGGSVADDGGEVVAGSGAAPGSPEGAAGGGAAASGGPPPGSGDESTLFLSGDGAVPGGESEFGAASPAPSEGPGSDGAPSTADGGVRGALAESRGQARSAGGQSGAPDETERPASSGETAAIEVGAAASSPLVRVDDAMETVDEAPLTAQEDDGAADEGVRAPGLREGRLVRSVDGEAVPDVAYVIGGVQGAPRTLVFLHDWAGKAEQWSDSLVRFAPEHRVLAVDFAAHGRSVDVEREAWTIPGLAGDVVEVLRAEDVTNAVIVGHSLGGQVALEVAARAPNRVMAVVGVDCFQSLRPSGSAERLAAKLELFRADFPKAIDEFVQQVIGPNAPEGLAESLARDAQDANASALLELSRFFGTYDPRDVTSSVRCPVVCINSNVGPTDVTGNRALIPGFDVSVLEDVGHWPHLEAPDRFHAELALRIESLGGGGKAKAGPLLRGAAPLLVVDDVEEVARFYRDALGFEVAWRVPAGEGAAELVALVRDETTLTLWSRSDFLAQTWAGPDPKTPAAAPGPSTVVLRVMSVERLRLRLGPELRDAATLEQRQEGPLLALFDPAGNLLLFVESSLGR